MQDRAARPRLRSKTWSLVVDSLGLVFIWVRLAAVGEALLPVFLFGVLGCAGFAGGLRLPGGVWFLFLRCGRVAMGGPVCGVCCPAVWFFRKDLVLPLRSVRGWPYKVDWSGGLLAGLAVLLKTLMWKAGPPALFASAVFVRWVSIGSLTIWF
jgi:hypothetical protein